MKLDESQIDAWLAEHSDWRREGDMLRYDRTFPSFSAAIAFVVQAAFLAEAADHHPDLDIRWCTVRIGLTTHDFGGITAKDFTLAEALSSTVDV